MMPFDSLMTSSGMRLHHDPVDVRDLVVAGVDGLERTHALRECGRARAGRACALRAAAAGSQALFSVP